MGQRRKGTPLGRREALAEKKRCLGNGFIVPNSGSLLDFEGGEEFPPGRTVKRGETKRVFS